MLEPVFSMSRYIQANSVVNQIGIISTVFIGRLVSDIDIDSFFIFCSVFKTSGEKHLRNR